jgi:hypothetical protein
MDHLLGTMLAGLIGAFFGYLWYLAEGEQHRRSLKWMNKDDMDYNDD